MNSLKGSGWRDLIKKPEYYAKATRETLAPIISRLSAVANKRLKRMEESGIQYSGYDKEDAIAGVKKFGAKGKSVGQLRAEYKRLSGFLKSKLSTLTGRKQEYYNARVRVWEHATPKEREKLGPKPTKREAYKEYEQSKREYREKPKDKRPTLSRIWDRTEIFDDVAKLFKVAREEGWISKSDLIYQGQASDQLQELFQEQVIRARTFEVENIIDYVRESLGIDSLYEEQNDDEYDNDESGKGTSIFF